MSVSRVFVDTNILVYAHDRQAGSKHAIARARIAELWGGSVVPAASVQVLQELFVNLLRKGVPTAAAGATVSDYMEWDIVDNDRRVLRLGLALHERWGLSLWDCLILAAAKRAAAEVIWSEGFSPAQDYGGVVVVNPLAGA
jgi:predicted nucleic acid-binding protein